jgi:hypothetical protein
MAYNFPLSNAIGTVLSSANTTGNALSAGTLNNVASLTLTPGSWDVSGVVNFISSGANTVTEIVMAISTANNNTTAADNFGSGIGMLVATQTDPSLSSTTGTTLFCGPGRLVVATNTTYFLNCAVAASILNCNAFGVIRAVRLI